MVGRYLVVVGVILTALISAALLTKPKPDDLRRAVEESLAAYERAQSASPDIPASKLTPQQTAVEAHDYLLALSYSTRLANGLEFFCIGALKVTYCSSPD